MFQIMRKRQAQEPASEAHHSEDPTLAPEAHDTLRELAQWHDDIIQRNLSRLPVPKDHFQVEVHSARNMQNHLDEFTGYVKFVRWDPMLTPAALAQIQDVEARVRKQLAKSSYGLYSRFVGLWFHVECPLPQQPAAPER